MNSPLLYHLLDRVANQFSLEVRLRRVVRDATLGVLVARSCGLGDIAAALRPLNKAASQYRRVQRFLANPAVNLAVVQQEWSRLVLGLLGGETVVLLVDETALSDHLKVMVLGVWGRGGCVPLAWRSYDPQAYPAEGQVALISNLLDRVVPALPIPRTVWVLADRGIGTSPALVEAVLKRGLDVLFRVQGSTRLRTADGQEVALRDLGLPEQTVQTAGEVFKKAGWLPAHVTVTWGAGYAHPWCLVSSRPVPPLAYGGRFDQEVSFRDLKSDGFQWQASHVWCPDHADRLLLLLALAYWLVLGLGQRLAALAPRSADRVSLFRLGRNALDTFIRPSIAPFLPHPPPRLTCVVQ